MAEWIRRRRFSTFRMQALGRSPMRRGASHQQSAAAEGNGSQWGVDPASPVAEATAAEVDAESLQLGGVHATTSSPADVAHGVQQPLQAGSGGSNGAAVVAVAHLEHGQAGVVG